MSGLLHRGSLLTFDNFNLLNQHAAMDSLKERLSPLQWAVTQQAATEPPYSNPFCNLFEPGRYFCICCDSLLFQYLKLNQTDLKINKNPPLAGLPFQPLPSQLQSRSKMTLPARSIERCSAQRLSLLTNSSAVLTWAINLAPPPNTAHFATALIQRHCAFRKRARNDISL